MVLVCFCQGQVGIADELEEELEGSLLEEDELDWIYDPLEPYNRLMFKINNALDKVFIKPVALVYRSILPGVVRTGIENFTFNFFAPVRVINFMLQRDSEHVVKTFFGFIVNTLFGFFGMVDVASRIGLGSRNTSLGDTLKKWGAGPGPYIVLPVFGPTSFRGAIGKAFHTQIDPIAMVSLMRYRRNTRNKLYYVIYGADLLAKRSSVLRILDELEKASDDPYVATRRVVMTTEK
ncbi:MAG: VacJ family lipoprotein [Holosporales bacterium]|nr:VacJ family lipoprotein [Holosporales bacterium]